MENIYLYTNDFSKQIKAESIFSATDNKNLFVIDKNKIDYEKFSKLFKKIVLTDNIITQKSLRLRKLVKEDIFQDFDEKIIPILKNFVSENDELYIDGILFFVLDEYKSRVNEFLYNLVRNCLILT